METGVEKYYNGDKNALPEISVNFTDYIAMLRAHIQKENRYFIIAEKEYLKDDISRISESFEKTEKEEIDERVHEKYLHLLESLKQQIKN